MPGGKTDFPDLISPPQAKAMGNLKRSQRVLSGLKLIGNFVERPLKLGDILLNDDGQHLIWGNIEDVIDGFSLAGKTVETRKADLKYTSESGVDVKLGGAADSGVAKGDIQLSFRARNSAFVALKGIRRVSVKLALIEAQLRQYWNEKGFDKPGNRRKYHFIAEMVEAASGTVIFSQERGNTIVLSGRGDTLLKSVSDAGNGRVEYVSNTKSTLEIISENPFQPLYTAVRFKADGSFEIVG
jgi:uncharacterized protein YbdZ (MbtH family)